MRNLHISHVMKGENADDKHFSQMSYSIGRSNRDFFRKELTLSQKTNSSRLKESADDNFKFDKNGRKLSKKVENTAGKGEIARYEQFLLSPQCFQKTCTADT